VWVRNRTYDAGQAARAYQQAAAAGTAGDNWTYEPALLRGQTLTVSALLDGAYTANWFDPQMGAWLPPAAATSGAGIMSISIPDFSRDLAVKLVPAGEPAAQ
jgi:hypothetical protein